MLGASTILIVAMSLTILVVSIVLSRQNEEKAEEVLNESSFLIADSIQEKRTNLLSTSRQIAETKSIFGMMIFLVRNRPHFDLLLMKQMYRYLTEAVLNICQTAKIDETVIYDMNGRPISFIKIKHGIFELGYIHSLSNLIGETALVVAGMDLEDGYWKPIEFPPQRTLEYHKNIPEKEEIRIELIDSTLSLVTLTPIQGETFDFQSKSMVIEQLGFLKSIQKIDDELFNRIESLTGVEINLVTNLEKVNELVRQYDLSDKQESNYSLSALAANHLFKINNGTLNQENYHMGIFPIYFEENPLALVEYSFSKDAEIKQTRETIRLLGMVFVLCILLVLPASIYYANSIAKPITQVVQGLKSIAAGKIHHLNLDIKSRDEVSELVNGFNVFSTRILEAQKQLRQLSNNIVRNQEMERASIARELHDELGQVLTALRLNAVWIRDRLKDSDPEVAEQALNMRDLIDHSIDEVRNIALRLRPRILDDLGLTAAVDWFVADFQKRTKIKCDLERTNLDEVDNNIAITIYRIMQEALTNVGRHSEADRAGVVIRCFNDKIFLEISDNGAGYDEQILGDSKGLGIPGIRERIILLNGTLEIKTGPEIGTTLFCSIPLIDKPNVIIEYD
jgi:signal transduction histidine kinase